MQPMRTPLITEFGLAAGAAGSSSSAAAECRATTATVPAAAPAPRNERRLIPLRAAWTVIFAPRKVTWCGREHTSTGGRERHPPGGGCARNGDRREGGRG